MKKNNLYNFDNIMILALIQVIGQFCLNFYIEINFFLIEADKKHSSRIRMISKDYHIGVLDKSISSKKFYVYDTYNGLVAHYLKKNLIMILL